MKCEYCDNPVPNGVTRCPSCGAAIKVDLSVSCMITGQKAEQLQSANPFPADPYLYVDKKSRIVYIILAIIFGEIGIHNFYAGYIGRGITQFLITTLSFGLLFWISWFWALIEICVVKQDGRSIPFE